MMTRTRPPFTTASHSVFSATKTFLFLALSCVRALAADPTNGGTAVPPAQIDVGFTNDLRQFSVGAYSIQGDPLLTNSTFISVLSSHTGTNVLVVELIKAASELQQAYRNGGYTNVTIAFRLEQITNDTAVMHVFRGARPQLLVDGGRVEEIAEANAPIVTAAAATPPGSTNAPATNAVPKIYVRAYEIRGDTLLSTKTLMEILAKHTGTNMTVQDIIKAGNELQMEYRARGYPTVTVTIPPQKLDTNGIVKIRIFEGRLANINVVNNRFFSSNNVMRALPGLHTNMILSRPVFEAELDRANANQDRQIYPKLEPGPEENTTDLTLDVKDRLPLHAKVDFNNQNSPGTPSLRVNTSAVYNNLWQYEHSLGVQYSFSPEKYKTGDWNFYDKPLVANYSAFYRLPLGNPEDLSDVVASKPGNFGFNEATRQFQLPPPSGRTELNFFGSRSTIDTGLETLNNEVIFDLPGVRKVTRQDVQQELTINNDLGFRLSTPLAATDKWLSTFQTGLDYKQYSLTSNKTNIFSFFEITTDENGNPLPPTVRSVHSTVPTTVRAVNYAPFSGRVDASERDASGTTTLGLGYSANLWFSGTESNLQFVTGSRHSTGHWVTLTPSVSRDFNIHKDWVFSLRLDGQVATEPLISTEQFGAGGVNSVRGYHEGEVFGDCGWFLGAEQKTPAHLLGMINSKTPLSVNGAVYMGYAQTYLLDPHGAQSPVSLWGTGFGTAFSAGSHWQARFLFSWPLLTAGTTQAYEPRFDFSLSAQF